MKKLIITLLAYSLFASPVLFAQSGSNGYYKDIFMDSGLSLTSTIDLPAARYLDLTMEAFISASPKTGVPLNTVDTILQKSIISGNALDENGVLLYPDGEPRYRMIYVNGGGAGTHGRSLGDTGRERMRQFVANGGSYLGTCAGAFLGSFGTIANETPRETYLHIWPGQTANTYLDRKNTGYQNYTGMFIEKDSPILKYYDFGGDLYIDSVKHNSGCFADTGAKYPAVTEPILRFDYPSLVKGKSFHKEISTWAYKENEEKGRVILIGSHPEAVTQGEQLELFSALVRYAIEGNGTPTIKGTLINNENREMICSTSDNNPAFTKIGDKQYHHFKVNVPTGVKKITINLQSVKGWRDYDLYLFADSNDCAFKSNAKYKNIALGVDKCLVIDAPVEGSLFISVYCDTTVDNEKTPYGIHYSGRVDVLNGVPYIIKIEY